MEAACRQCDLCRVRPCDGRLQAVGLQYTAVGPGVGSQGESRESGGG